MSWERSKESIQKTIPDAPHEVLLVLDGSTGQNALEQAKHFTATTDVTALAITKLDGTAKGGVVLAITDQFKIPVKFIGVGEKMEDLLVFDKHEFVDSLFNLRKGKTLIVEEQRKLYIKERQSQYHHTWV